MIVFLISGVVAVPSVCALPEDVPGLGGDDPVQCTGPRIVDRAPWLRDIGTLQSPVAGIPGDSYVVPFG